MVTIPCDACGEPVGLAERCCRACDRPLSRALVDARGARLAASSAPFRALDDTVHGATFAVLVLGIVHLGFGLFLYLLERSADALFDPDLHTDAGNRLGGSVALGVGLLACSLAARTAPARGLVAALAWAALCLGASHARGSSPSALGMMFGVASHAFLVAMVYRGGVSALRRRLYAADLAHRAPARSPGSAWDEGHAYRHGPAAPGAPDAPVEPTPWLARLPRVLSALLP